MSSWRSKFRRNRGTDTQETKASSSFISSKNTEDTDSTRKQISRFLRRSTKHDYSVRPQSMYIEKSVPMVANNESSESPNVQEILDKNRHLRRSNSKSPKSWKRLITGERSPSVIRKTDNRSTEHDNYNASRVKDCNSNNQDFTQSTLATKISNESAAKMTSGDRLVGDSEYVRERLKNNGNRGNTTSAGTWGNENSPGAHEQQREASMERKARSGSPYDNISPRRERRSRSLYFGGASSSTGCDQTETEQKTGTPRRKRRQKINRDDSQIIEEETSTVQIVKKDSFVLRKPKAKYPVDDDDNGHFLSSGQRERESLTNAAKPVSQVIVKKGDVVNDTNPGRRISHIRRQKSMQLEDEAKQEEPEASKKKAAPSKSDDPQIKEKERSNLQIVKKDSFVLRKPRAKYPVDDDDDIVSGSSEKQLKMDEKKKNIGLRSYGNEARNGDIVSRGSSVASLRSTASSDKVERSYGSNTGNIVGVTMKYLEHQSKSELTSLQSSRNATTDVDEADSFLQRRRRYQGLLGDKRYAGSSALKYENPLYKSIDYVDNERRNSNASENKQAVDPGPRRRESYAKARPKSLYSYGGDSLDFTDSLSKFQTKEKESSFVAQSKEGRYSVWERYKVRNIDDDSTSDTSSRAASVASGEERKPRQRPTSLFMVDESDTSDKKTAYRGNWSASVPKKPAHLRDFSMPDEKSAARVSYRRRESQQQQKQERNAIEPVDPKTKEDGKKEQFTPSFEMTLESPEADKKADDLVKNKEEQSVKARLNLPGIEIADEDSNSGSSKLEVDASKDNVVRRRRRERGSIARPSSVYIAKTSINEDGLITSINEDDGRNLREKDEDMKADEDEGMKSRKKVFDAEQDDDGRTRRSLLDSEDIKTGLRRRSAVERRIKSKRIAERPKSVVVADVSRVNIHDPLSASVDEVKRQFDRLLARTENWKQRTESLDTKATVLTSSYRSLRRTINEIQGNSDDVYAVFDEIDTRLTENDTIGFPSTEDDWRRAMQGNKLIEKALKSLLEQQRNPKPEFYYSESESEPESPVESFYDMSNGSTWSSPDSNASRNRRVTDYYPLYSLSKSPSDSSSLSHTKTTRGDFFTSEYSFTSSNTRLSSLLSDGYSWRKRLQDTSSYDYRRDTSLRNSYAGRYIPETSV
eukprot:gene16772-18466_t